MDVHWSRCEGKLRVKRQMFISPVVKIICPCPEARLRNSVNGIHEEFVKVGARIIIIMSDLFTFT